MFKGMCYIVLIVGFLMFFNKDPVFCIVIVGGGVGIYAYFKLRKRESTTSSGNGGFFSKSPVSQPQSDGLKDIMMFMAMQQMFSDSQHHNSIIKVKEDSNSKENENSLSRKKQEILELFEEEG